MLPSTIWACISIEVNKPGALHVTDGSTEEGSKPAAVH